MLEGNRKNILYNFINIYPNYIEKLDQNLESKVFNVVDGNNEDIIKIYIVNSFMSLYKYKKYKNNKKDKTHILNMVNKYYKNQINILNEETKEEKKEEIILESKKHFICDTYFSLQKIIVYLTENIISEDLALYVILNNSPEILNISNYAIEFFKKNKEFSLKHLFALYELFEKLLFLYIVKHIDMKYNDNISMEIYDEILLYFKENEVEETIFSLDQLKEALRKYISRYLISKDIPKSAYLFDELNKPDLWPKEIYSKLFDGLFYFKNFNILTKHAKSLYELLAFKCSDESDILENKDTPEAIFYSKYNFLRFNNLENNNTLELLSSFKEIKSYNIGRVVIKLKGNEDNVICITTNEEIIFCSFDFSNNYNYLKKTDCKSKFKNKDENIKFVTYLEENDLFCFGILYNKLKFIRAQVALDKELECVFVQEIQLEKDSQCLINIIEFSQNIIISSDQNNIIIFKKEDNIFKKNDIIKINFKSYLKKIKDDEFCALISNNTLRFYKLKGDKFSEDKIISEINVFEFIPNKNDEKRIMKIKKENLYSMENIYINKRVLLKNNYLCICGETNNIYLIDIKSYEIINNFNFYCRYNFVSIINWINDTIMLCSNNYLYIFNLFEEKEKDVLYFYDRISNSSEAFITVLFGIKRVTFNQDYSININNFENFIDKAKNRFNIYIVKDKKVKKVNNLEKVENKNI